MGRLSFGVTLTTSTRGKEMPTLRRVLDYAMRCEELEFDSLWVFDHVVYPHRTLDAIVTLGAVAAVTKRVKLGTAILILPARSPLVVAKEASTLDYISDGRLILGVGTASRPERFETWSSSYSERVEKLIEGIQIIRKVWTESEADFEGKHYRFKGVVMGPKPIQKPSPPIMLGGFSDRLLRVAAAHCDGYIGGYANDAHTFRTNVRKLRRFMEERGRNSSKFILSFQPWTYIASTPGKVREGSETFLMKYFKKPFEEARRKGCIVGTPDEFRAQLTEYVDAGLDTLIFNPISLELSQLEEYRDMVVSYFR